MTRYQRLAYAEVIEQLESAPRVLARYDVRFSQRAQAAQRHVLQIADRGWDYGERHVNYPGLWMAEYFSLLPEVREPGGALFRCRT
jgi:hypothetical protein